MVTKAHVVSGDHMRRTAVAKVTPHAHWLLRIGFASVFLFHGLGKLLGGGGITGFAAMMNLAPALALLVALAEVAAAIGIVAGGVARGSLGDLTTRLAGVAIVPVMLGAIALVHWPRWSFVAAEAHPMGGMEFQVILLLLGLYFLARGNDV